MNNNIVDRLESLLYEDEGSSLDFKASHYSFRGADDAAKSEVLKDVLAFANAWRRTDAYILIGVQEVRGGKSKVLGVKEHLDDASLQQFVNSKTNRPVEFSYHVCHLEGAEIGVIRIAVQERPTYLLGQYGHLRENEVFLRRGSSTVVASPEEIARMGVAGVLGETLPPALRIEFLDETTLERSGTDAQIEVDYLILPSSYCIPDYEQSGGGLFDVSLPLANRDYYRDFAKHISDKYGLKAVSFQIENPGGITALDVRLTIHVNDEDQSFRFKANLDLVDCPSSIHPLNSAFRDMVNAPEGFRIRKLGRAWDLEYSVGKIQPRASTQVCDLYVGARTDCRIPLACSLFADNLSEPLKSELCVAVSVNAVEISSDELQKYAHELL